MMKYNMERTKNWRPMDMKYTILQDANSAMIPAMTRAAKMPRSRPASTTDNAAALRSGGAKSAANGSRIWGVTVNIPVRNDSASNTTSFFVTESPIVREAETRTINKRRGRLRTRSPIGESKRIPTAYLGEFSEKSGLIWKLAYPA